MSNKILFLGKYDDNLFSLEEKVVNISKEPLDPEIKNSKPNFIRYPVEEFNFEVWIIVGNVKPTKLFKNLINEAKIIILTFNLVKKETICFLNEGWWPIVNKYKAIDNQELIVIGTKTSDNIDESQIDAMKNNIIFDYSLYFTVNVNNPNSKFIQYIKSKFIPQNKIGKNALKKNSKKRKRETKEKVPKSNKNDDLDNDENQADDDDEAKKIKNEKKKKKSKKPSKKRANKRKNMRSRMRRPSNKEKDITTEEEEEKSETNASSDDNINIKENIEKA